MQFIVFKDGRQQYATTKDAKNLPAGCQVIGIRTQIHPERINCGGLTSPFLDSRKKDEIQALT